MKPTRILSLIAAGLIFTLLALRHSASLTPNAQQATQTPANLAAILDRDISSVERQILDVAEAMPEDKFNFTPESLNIPWQQLQGSAHICHAAQARCRFELFHLVADYRR